MEALANEARRVGEALPGERNDTLNRAVFSLFQLCAPDPESGLPHLVEDHVEEVLAAAAEMAGLDESEIRSTVRSALAGAQRNPRTTLPPVVDSTCEGSVADWDEPVPLGRQFDTQAFPVAALPEPFSSFVSELAEELQVPLALPAAVVLGVLAAVVGGRAQVNVYDRWIEQLSLMIAVTLNVGERKSATVSRAIAPLEAIERRVEAEVRPETVRALAEREVMEGRVKSLKKEAVSAESIEQAKDAFAEVVDLEVELADFEIPSAARLLADDATPEALASLMHRNDGRIALISAEAGSVFSMMEGRYTDGGFLDLYLKGHSGESVRIDRKGRGSERIDNACLTIMVSPQPALMERVGENLLFRGRGIVARFLYMLPGSRLGSRTIAPVPVSDETNVRYEEAVESLFNRLTAAAAREDQHP